MQRKCQCGEQIHLPKVPPTLVLKGFGELKGRFSAVKEKVCAKCGYVHKFHFNGELKSEV